jgi:hypothetical protein
MTSNAVKLFFSYSHKDESLRDTLATHLSNLEWQGVISSWHDRKIVAGTEWNNEIKTSLDAADIILLLISPDFIASKYCRDIEIPQALQRHEVGEAYVIPVILRPFDWSDAPFARLQAYPKDAKAVTLWANQDEAFVSVTQGIRTVAKLLQDQRRQKLQRIEAARTQYLKKVEEVLSDGRISIGERDTLNELQDELGLTPEEANEIEARAFEPYKRYVENLERYKQTFLKIIHQGYPFSEETRADLELRRRDLGLKPEDVEKLETSILEAEAAKHQGRHIMSDIEQIANDPLDSEKGLNYTNLQQLLKAQKLREADYETYLVMLQALGRQKGDWIRDEEIANFPCTDLRTIDQLWMKYTEGRFGFSAQWQIWQDVNANYTSWADYVGWRVNGQWVPYEQLTYRLDGASGQLPLTCYARNSVPWATNLFSRVETCLSTSIPQSSRTSPTTASKTEVKTNPPKNNPGSAPEVDYVHLRNLLKAGQWQEADQLTAAFMLKVAGREEQGWLRAEDLEGFPFIDLNAIDQLWMDYSKERFGFTVQKRIWQEVNAKYSLFGERAGWCVSGKWIEYENFNFNQKAARGHLPGWVTRFWYLADWRENKRRCISLFSRLEACKR